VAPCDQVRYQGSGDRCYPVGSSTLFSVTAGFDTIYGDAGIDILNGNANDDALNGDAGNDTLNGGDGRDILNGGAGDDTCNTGAPGSRPEPVTTNCS
jgi:Ca2+-binding RTX toxin-like protein